MRQRTPCLSIAFGVVVFLGGSPEAPPSSKPPVLVLKTPPATAVESVAVSPDGSLVATAAGEGGVRIYDAKTGALLRTIGEVGDRSVSFSADSRSLAAGGFHMDKLVGIYDVQTGKRVRTLSGHTEWEADACTFSPDGTLVASTGTDKQILVWDVATGAIRHRLAGQPYRVTTLAFSPDGVTLACGGNKSVGLWDMRAGRLRQTLTGHRDWVCTVAFSPDGATIASGSCDWSFHRGHDWPRPEWRGPEQCEWRLWDAASGKLKRAVSDSGRLLSLAFAPDGKSLACGIGTEVRLYHLSSQTPSQVVTSHHHDVTSVAFVPDGTAIISSSHDHTVKRVSLVTGEEAWHAPGQFEQVNSVALSEDGTILATASSDGRFGQGLCNAAAKGIGPGTVRLWHAHTGRMLRRLGDSTDQFMAVALSADGKRVVAGGASPDGKGVVHVWNATTGARIWSMDDHAAEVLAVAFAPDGSSLASGSADGTIQVRDSRTGSVSRTLAGHVRDLVTLFAFTEMRAGSVKDDWLAYHPDGYYDGSPGVDRLLAWRVGDVLLTLESLGRQLHRPERVVSALKLEPSNSGSP
jgi:WD40 repeat protein